MKKWILLVLTVSLAVSTYMKKLLIRGSLLLLFSCFFNAVAAAVCSSLSIAVWKKKEMEKGKKQRFKRDTLFYTTKYTLIRIYRKIGGHPTDQECFLSFFYIERRITPALCKIGTQTKNVLEVPTKRHSHVFKAQ